MKNNRFAILTVLVCQSLVMLLLAAAMVTVVDDGSVAHRFVAWSLTFLSAFPIIATIIVLKHLKAFARQAEQCATRDPLTNLYNKKIFWDYLGYEIERAKRQGYRFAVMLVDLDDFKRINDTYNHEVGDAYLLQFAQIFKAAIRKGDIAARYGGDNFAAILPMCDESQALSAAERLRESIRDEVFRLPDKSLAGITASVGLAVFPDHAQAALSLYEVADNMLHQAKVSGKNRIDAPGDELNMALLSNAGNKSIFILESIRLRRIVPYFQPIVDVSRRQIMAYEVLTRIVTPARVIAAAEFIVEAEVMGAIGKIDYLLIEQALEMVKRKKFDGKLFFNLSPKALLENEFMSTMRGFMNQYGVEPKQLVFEITERDTVKNLGQVEDIVRGLKRDGFQLAIDDFGAGYSSFQYIKAFQVDYLKIDGDFIKSMTGRNNRMERAIVANIASLADELGIRTIAEYVETEDILQNVRAAGVDFAQGYFIRHPHQELVESYA